MTTEYGWGRDVFSLAIALQNLLWGVGQPFAGAVADRFGAVRVICAGAILYALGLAVMAYAATPGLMHLGAGVLIGFGLSGSSFNLILGAFGKLLPPEWRPLAFGAGTAAGSLGQFFFPPVANLLIDGFGWHQALVVFAVTVLVAMPFSLVLARRGDAPGGRRLGGGRAPVDPAGARRGVPAPQLRAARARLLHLRLPARLHHRASAGLPQGRRAAGLGRRLDARRDRACERRRLALGRAG